ncbi:MAG: hypothetical protein ACRD1L_05250 [Terriglobales bacterium]
MPVHLEAAVIGRVADPRALTAALLTLVAAGLALIWLRRRRRPTPEQVECARRLKVNANGRIAAGEILDMLPAPVENGEKLAPTLVYQYQVGGVTYQVSQALHLVPVALDPTSYIPGWPVQVKYEPSNPGNSIVACEHWVGLSGGRLEAGKSKAAGRGPG